jgi:long-chain acyl-CoA synthetase
MEGTRLAGVSIAEAQAVLTAPGARFEMETAALDERELRVWKNALPTMRDLVARMQRHDDPIFLVYEDERLSFGETCRRIYALASHLRERCGVEKGDRVAIAMRNYPEWPIAFFAATSIGAIAVPLNAWWTGEELEYGLADSGTSVLIADAERADVLMPHLPKLEIRHVLVARPEKPLPAGFMDLAEAIAQAGAREALPDAELAPDDVATIFYTSGTTGHPKGALGTHRNMLTNIMSAQYAQARNVLRKEGMSQTRSGPAPQRAALISVPFFHVTGSHSVMAANAAAGNKLVMMYRWNAERALELIERERINVFGGVPSMVWQVLESPDFTKRDTSSVVNVGYGGAPAPPELERRIRATFPTVTASNGYGMTETSAITTSNGGLDYERKPDSVGMSMPVVDVKVIDTDGNALPTGSIGELCIRGPNVVRGYWNKPEATADTFRDGWCHSGDIAKIDEEGFVYIVDRAKDMLIRGGENIYCVEIEDVLYKHEAVMDAAVVGLPHHVLGEEVGAVVQIVPNAVVTEEQLKRHVGEHLAKFKIPMRIDLRAEPLPRNANGKILKSQLKKEMLGEAG